MTEPHPDPVYVYGEQHGALVYVYTIGWLKLFKMYITSHYWFLCYKNA